MDNNDIMRKLNRTIIGTSIAILGGTLAVFVALYKLDKTIG